MIENTLLHFKTKAAFNTELEAGNIKDDSIAFIDESKEIWTHGTYYDCSELDLSNIATKEELASKLDVVVAANTYATKTEIEGKQDTISDIETIRSGAAKGATSLQSVPAEYVTETELANKGYATTANVNSSLNGKVDKVNGKQLSTEDFTTVLKNKLESLSNYDDTTVSGAINKLRTDFDTLVSGDTTTAIKSFNDIVAFLDGITDNEDLESIIASIEQQIAAKQDNITDLDTIRSGAALGATALQSYTEKYTGTYSKPSTGIPKTDLASAVQTSLGKADTALQSYTETDPVFSASAAAGIKSSDITNWNGKTSNTGTVTQIVAGTGLTGGTITTSGTIALTNSGVTAGTYGPSSDVTGSNNSTISIPQFIVDEYGRITSVTNRTYTSVDNNTTYSALTASDATTGTSTSAKTISAKVLHDKIVGTAVVNDGNILNITKVSALPSSPDANTLYIVVN